MAPAKQVKVIREFQKQSSQLDMTVSTFILLSDASHYGLTSCYKLSVLVDKCNVLKANISV